jgi:hypothetical protein
VPEGALKFGEADLRNWNLIEQSQSGPAADGGPAKDVDGVGSAPAVGGEYFRLFLFGMLEPDGSRGWRKSLIGGFDGGPALRVVTVQADGKTFLLATTRQDSPEDVGLIYRFRWQVELYFKWLKTMLPCGY